MNSIKATLRRYRRLMIWVFSIIVLYTMMGFFLIPWLAEKQLVSILDQRLGIQASVQKIAFNPYTFELTVDDLQLNDANKQPLAGWSKLYVNAQPSQLVKRNLTIEEISIDSPKLHFRRYSATDNALTRLAQSWNQTAVTDQQELEKPVDSEKKEPLVTFIISNFNYTKGELHYRDDVPTDDFETVFSPINIHLADFSTQAGHAASNDLVIDFENKGELRLNGNLVLSPLHLDGQVSLKNFNLGMPYRYLKDELPFEFNNGLLDLNLAYIIDINGPDATFKFNKIDLELANFSINQIGEPAAILNASTIKISNGDFAYPDNQLSIDSILFDDFKIVATQNKQGELNWVQMFATPSEEQNTPEPEGDNAKPLKLDIANIAIANTRLELEDQAPETPVSLSVNLAANLQNFSLLADNNMPFTSTINLESGGKIDLQGDIQLFPSLALNSTVSIQQLSLVPVQPYLSQYAYIGLINGSIDSTAKITTDDQEPLAFEGNLELTSLQLDNQQLNEKLLSLDKLAFKSVNLSLAKQSLDISEVAVDKLYSRILVNQTGETNIGLLVKKQAETTVKQQDTPPEEQSPNYEFTIGKVKLNDASSQYTDENLPIVFHANMHKLNGEISGFSTRSQQPVDITLEGQVDEFGLVEINGSMNPLNITNQTSIKLAFTNLDLPSVSPYTIKFAGREIAEGRGDIELTYDVINNELNATNKVVIRDIRLGGKVESPGALDLPLDLAIALLKNSDGVIDLSIPVKGNVNDPQFSMGPVIRGAIANAISNIVTAPFRFLASLLGSSDESIKDVRFRAGRSDLAPPEQEKLLNLATALQQRPQLVLVIPAPFDEATDRQILKVKAVERRIETNLENTDAEHQLMVRNQMVLERLYTEATLSPDVQTIKHDLIELSKTPEKTDGELDVLVYNAKLKAGLIEIESITDSDLRNLALARQNSVIAFLKEHSELKEKQLQTSDLVSKKSDDGWLSMPFKLDAL
mgnify:CR=1 FL=1|tara:strand:+ start:64780 stop:67725 length:2946 start_codon:yes stop_codon:yes gene_type:complete